MKKESLKLKRGQKILLFMYEFGSKEKKKIPYEDLVVGLYKKYRNDFHLKGYPEYPDSSDSTQRILYEYKKNGYISVINKVFSLTDRGIELVQSFSSFELVENTIENRSSRVFDVEVDRIKSLEGFWLFLEGRTEEHTDSDFYKYFSITPRSSSSGFSSRIATINSVIKEIDKTKQNTPLLSKIFDYHNYILDKYNEVIDYFLNK